MIAIGYPDEATAEAAADEARQLARDLIIEPDAMAVIVRDGTTPVLGLGASGGRRILASVVQMLAYTLQFGMGAEGPRADVQKVVHEHLPLSLEPGDVIDGLKQVLR